MKQKPGRDELKQMASDVLVMADSISQKARAEADPPRSPPNLAGVVNPTSSNAAAVLSNLRQIGENARASARRLAKEPLVARVVYTQGNDDAKVLYICRAMPPNGCGSLASYRAPMGRLAELPPGDATISINGSTLELTIREREFLQMFEEGGHSWDSRDTVVEGSGFEPFTIRSLRSLIPEATAIDDHVGRILADEQAQQNVRRGIQKAIIFQMGLRDQPVLDQYQGHVFRLPINSSVLLVGPPGTGKTTTLVRRIGQKLDQDHLSPDEAEILDSVRSDSQVEHSKSWWMFAPTELLSQYVRAAFNVEGVAATDANISTWRDYALDVGRNVLAILRSGTGSGRFVVREEAKWLADRALHEQIPWFEDFHAWQMNLFIEELRNATQELGQSNLGELAAFAKRLAKVLAQRQSARSIVTIAAASEGGATIRPLLGQLRQSCDGRIRHWLNERVKADIGFLEAFVVELTRILSLVDPLQPSGMPLARPSQGKAGKAEAISALEAAVRADAIARANRKQLSPHSKSGMVMKWIGDRGLQVDTRRSVGRDLRWISLARRLLNVVPRYFRAMGGRYIAYRKDRLASKAWYTSARPGPSDLHPVELDLLLLASLRAANELVQSAPIRRNIDQPHLASLRALRSRWRSQICVDEVTDFSPVQIACMVAIGDPRVRSFFACGDINQRITTWGVRSIQEVRWAVPGLEEFHVSIAYRQSRRLLAFGQALLEIEGLEASDAQPPAAVDSDGVSPALLERARDINTTALWLAERIVEIERMVGKVPSIGVLVSDESEVQRLAPQLKSLLAEYNIGVMPCPNGVAIGHEAAVRVFDVQYVKGMEFEAAFFVGVDRLAQSNLEMFHRHLYVGATRAATYLGLTCDATLPSSLEKLRGSFVPDWSR